jgi:hypothetical protein
MMISNPVGIRNVWQQVCFVHHDQEFSSKGNQHDSTSQSGNSVPIQNRSKQTMELFDEKEDVSESLSALFSEIGTEKSVEISILELENALARLKDKNPNLKGLSFGERRKGLHLALIDNLL